MAASEGAEDPVLSLVDVLEEDEELENEACAVLGGSDAEKCSYPEGYVKRQALYACNTCTPKGEEPAGICLACSYKCHEGHELFELYTKRNFRCDCGNSKFKNVECKFFPEKEKVNAVNKYNDNFFGLYCTCKRPYPDPEDETPDEMIQCVVCEDWFHGRHLGALPPENMDFQEMVCQACVSLCPFLCAYADQFAVPSVTRITSHAMDGEVEVAAEKGLKAETGAALPDIIPKEITTQEQLKDRDKEQYNGPSTSTKAERLTEVVVNGGGICLEKEGARSACKLQKLPAEQDVKRNAALYWPSSWRRQLCTCQACRKMYSDLEVLFLLDECDTVLAYENKGKRQQEGERRDPLMTALSSMDRVQQLELICEYNDLKTELKDYLKRFAEEGKVVTSEDIQQFFEELRSRKRRRVDGMQYYCS
ncbi:putative E3 ubiquitin-protein ligase UBR7 [Rhinatrema bivittatum]|uniref:putative E3 ubiquitin-protein ligase UBR7 n=1 Tax=Rhinatrema bivittatum TaxID=194408 RepID=UPI00112A871C|nr:putative E3 ubiquitin-protein ligase UBR7 [Rhinatrema bivittatum]